MKYAVMKFYLDQGVVRSDTYGWYDDIKEAERYREELIELLRIRLSAISPTNIKVVQLDL